MENIDRSSKEVQSSTEKVIHRNGKQPRPLSVTERTENFQIKRRRLEHHDAAVLQRRGWWHLCQLSSLHTQIESRGLKWCDLFTEEDPTTGNERLALRAECSSHQAFQPVAQAITDLPMPSHSPVLQDSSHKSTTPQLLVNLKN